MLFQVTNLAVAPVTPATLGIQRVCGNFFNSILVSFHFCLVVTSTVVGDNINIIKTTFELNFDFYQAFKQHEYTKIWKERKAVNLKSFTLITCKLVIRKKLK